MSEPTAVERMAIADEEPLELLQREPCTGKEGKALRLQYRTKDTPVPITEAGTRNDAQGRNTLGICAADANEL